MYDLTHIENVGAFGRDEKVVYNGMLDAFRVNMMHAYQMDLQEAIENSRTVYNRLDKFVGAEELQVPSIEVSYAAIDRARELTYMNLERFCALFEMAYNIVANNSKWMLAQNKGDMSTRVREANLLQIGPITEALEKVANSLVTKFTDRFEEEDFAAVDKESMLTTKQLLKRLYEFYNVLKRGLSGLTVPQDVWHELYVPGDSVVAHLMAWGRGLHGIYTRFYSGVPIDQKYDPSACLFSRMVPKVHGGVVLDQTNSKAVIQETERSDGKKDKKLTIRITEKDADAQRFYLVNTTGWDYPMIDALIGWNLFGAADNWVRGAPHITKQDARMGNRPDRKDSYLKLETALKKSKTGSMMRESAAAMKQWSVQLSVDAARRMCYNLTGEDLNLDWLKSLTGEQRIENTRKGARTQDDSSDISDVDLVPLDEGAPEEGDLPEKEKKKEKKLVVWLAALGAAAAAIFYL